MGRYAGSCAAAVLAAVVGARDAAAQPTPLGDEFVVNAYTTGLQFAPAQLALYLGGAVPPLE